MASLVFILIAFIGILLGGWQWLAATRFFFTRENRIRTGDLPSDFPPLTILKPVSGADAVTQNCIRSWLAQNYSGPVQWLFGVESESDPAVKMISGLIQQFPGLDIEMVVCSRKRGENPKVSVLLQLCEKVKNDWMIVSDADVRIADGFLNQFVAEMKRGNRGITCCLYRLISGDSLPLKFERLHHNIDFWSQVLMSVSMKPMDYALGAVMGFQKTTLDRCGGLEAVANVLADDYQLGRRVTENGFHVALSGIIVDCETAFQSFQKVWSHQVRWSRTIRICRPVSYAFSLVVNVSFWSLLAMIAAQDFRLQLIAGSFMIIRILLARSLLLMFSSADWNWKCWFLVPLKDLLHVLILIAGYTGNRILWKDREYCLAKDGRLSGFQRSE